MSAYLRPWLVLLALAAPGTARNAEAETDWSPVIVQPSSWDWLPAAAHLPSLGVHKAALRRE